jgi:SpoVK/Ycf46/Vps4 family AAA+-type ATPase
VLATTNRPDQIDPALRRPGRFDQVVWMGLPDAPGRTALFEHCMQGLKLDEGLDHHDLAATLAGVAEGLTGADIAFVCRRAALLCVKEAARAQSNPDDLAITTEHLYAAVAVLASPPAPVAASVETGLRVAG